MRWRYTRLFEGETITITPNGGDIGVEFGTQWFIAEAVTGEPFEITWPEGTNQIVISRPIGAEFFEPPPRNNDWDDFDKAWSELRELLLDRLEPVVAWLRRISRRP